MTTVVKVLGPPGCGKTTFLLSTFRECLSHTTIERMGYFSFSKQAAYEALERAEKHIELTGSDRLTFSTLHSFAYRLLDLHREDIFNNTHERVFAKKMGLKRQWDNDQGVFSITKDDRIAAIVKYAAVTKTPVQEVWKDYAFLIPWPEVKRYMDGLEKYDAIDIIGCGSAYHVGMVGKSLIEKYGHVRVNVDIASEYRYTDHIYSKKHLIILISQSGETADTLASLRIAKEMGATTMGVVNVFGSSIAREVDIVVYTNALTEIAVATTKAYLMQCFVH